MRTINCILSVVVAVALAAVTGCAAEDGGSPAPPAASSSVAAPADGSAQPTEGVIAIRDFKYEVPASVKPGAMVTVTNSDSAPHTVTAKDEGGFDIEIPGGATVTFQAPDAPGEYAIICSFHPQMAGTLAVK